MMTNRSGSGAEQMRTRKVQWISAPDVTVNHNAALKMRQQGTGDWFIQREDFSQWKTIRNSFLWLSGTSGCGKTILSSTIIEHLRSNSSIPLIYFYFTFSDITKQSLENMVRSLILQLYSTKDITHHLVGSLYSTYQNGQQQPTCKSLSSLLFQMLNQVGEIYMIVDALDECYTKREGPSTEGVLSYLEQLLCSDCHNVHILVTSRPEHNVQALFDKCVHPKNQVAIQSSLISGDISAYVHKRVGEDNRLGRWQLHQDIQEQIEINLNEEAHRMFRWVTCQLDALEECLDYRSLKDSLALLPKTLDETYARVLQNIPEEHKQNAIRILQLLTYSERPLTTKELIDAMSIDIDISPHFDPKCRTPDLLEILRYCSSLVVMTSGVLQLAHLSVHEYLTSNRLKEDTAQYFEEVAAKGAISTICLASLLRVDRQLSSRHIRDVYPFAQYSATYWMTYAAVAEGSNKTLQSLIMKFISHKDAYKVCYSLYCPDQLWISEPETHAGTPALPLYYTSLSGLIVTTRWLLNNGADINAQSGHFANALQAASYNGHQQVVKQLLAAGANVNAQGGYFGNALQAASFSGHQQVVEQLLTAGADVNAQGGRYGNALLAASYNGHQQMVERLLAAGVEVNAQAIEDYEWLAGGVDVNPQGEDYGNALAAASLNGHRQVVEQLLAAGADVNAQGGDYGYALAAASLHGHWQVVEQLLAAGADVNAQGGDYGNALQAASSNDHQQVVEQLLAAGADINAKGGNYENALQAASLHGHQQVFEQLLAAGADVNAQGGNHGNAISAASLAGHQQMVERLLVAGADVNAQSGVFHNALQCASLNGHQQVVERLLAAGADVNAQGTGHGNALSAAAFSGHQQVVKQLLAAGADVNAQGGTYSNALYAASYNGHQQVVKQLLTAGADVNAQGGRYGTALQAASHEGHQQVFEQLLAAGAGNT